MSIENSPVLDDLHEMAAIMRERGGGDTFRMNVRLSYAQAIVKEMRECGVDMPEPGDGDTLQLMLQANGLPLHFEIQIMQGSC